MKRIKQTVIYILIIMVLAVFATGSWDLHLTRQGAVRSHEIALRYGPAKKILVDYVGRNGQGVVISSLGQYGLAVVEVIRQYNFFWTAGSSSLGGGVLEDGEKAWASYDYQTGVVYGVANVASGTKLTCYIGQHDDGIEAAQRLEMIVENEFFWGVMDPALLQAEHVPYIWQVVDETGEVLFRY